MAAPPWQRRQRPSSASVGRRDSSRPLTSAPCESWQARQPASATLPEPASLPWAAVNGLDDVAWLPWFGSWQEVQSCDAFVGLTRNRPSDVPPNSE